jgi:hypothetical protein
MRRNRLLAFFIVLANLMVGPHGPSRAQMLKPQTSGNSILLLVADA